MTDKLTTDIKQLKTQKRLLINQINKIQSEYNNKYIEQEAAIAEKLQNKYNKIEAKLLKDHETKMKSLIAKQEKDMKRTNRREARQTKKNKVKTSKTIATQTDSSIVKTTEISIQTEPEKKVNPKVFSLCNNILQNTIDNMFKKEISIQCNLIEEQKIEAIERTTTNQSSNINNDYYILSYFKLIDRKSTKKLNKVCYINENLDIRYKRDMLGVLDTNNDIYNITFSSKFMGPINICLYSEKEHLATLVYTFFQNKQNVFTIVSNKKKELARHTFDIPLKSVYEIKMSGNNNIYNIHFNNQHMGEINLNKEIKYFFSNANFNIIYN